MGMPTRKRLGLLALAAWQTSAFAQDIGISVPPALQQTHYHQCEIDFESEYSRAIEGHKNKIKVLESGISDLKQLRLELLDNKIFLGLGPAASGDEAQQIAQILHNVKTMADIFSTMFEASNPKAGVLGKYVPGRVTSLNVYNVLKAGEFISDFASAEGMAELTFVLTSNLAPLRPDFALAASIAENIHAARSTYVAWSGYRDELQQSLARIDSDLHGIQARLREEDTRIYRSLRDGFDRFCSESLPPRAFDDKFSAAQGETVLYPVTDNDHSPNGGSLRLVAVEHDPAKEPFRGSASIDYSMSTAGALRYVAPMDFVGTESLQYAVVDGSGLRSKAKVTILVTARKRDTTGPYDVHSPYVVSNPFASTSPSFGSQSTSQPTANQTDSECQREQVRLLGEWERGCIEGLDGLGLCQTYRRTISCMEAGMQRVRGLPCPRETIDGMLVTMQNAMEQARVNARRVCTN